jgi:tetratricopeptide (TPR) repeat protein
VTSNLINPLEKGKFSAGEASDSLRNINALKKKFTEDKKIPAILTLATGIIYDSAGKPDAAKPELEESIKLSHPNDLTYYIANIRLAEMEKRAGKNVEAEKYYSAAINRYSRRFKTENFRDKLLWIINYYEQAGERSSSKGDFAAASHIYDKYINLVTLIHNKRLYPEIYTEYAPRAHVLYIDAYTGWKGDQGINELEKSYNDKLPILRMDFNRAALYGLAYIYTKKAMLLDSEAGALITTVSKESIFENLYLADKQIEWALFLDDTFIEPYLLKSWIYLFIDLRRKELGDDIESAISGFFPKRLWEKNIPLLDKALNANNEKLYPENEGNIHINMGNSYFLLLNYPRALNHYNMARKYKKVFGSDIEKALFHFHTGYALWQNGVVKDAREEISKAYGIYNTLAAGSASKYKNQTLSLYRYFALFSRYEDKFADAINWYKKIVKHAEDYKIEIDKARYMQEIAFCYKELGDFDTAKSYIDTADRLLRDYPDDTRKYYLRIKLFGKGPFPVYNMGPDTAVIGDNKIFYPLDTWNKELLNISMLEEISVKNSDYAAAIAFLKKKVSLLEENETSVSVETQIRSLNNLGYYYFRSGDIKQAEKNFNKAGDLASEKNNLQGIFSSMMNLANLYALMIEEEKNEGHNWIGDTEKFLLKIENYRNSYFDTRFTQEKKSLEAAAEAKNLKVTPEQISTLKKDIEKQTAAIYYALDISIATMKFYRAELLYSASALSKDETPAYNLYTHNRDLYNLYADALSGFESAISIADKQNNKELKVKLLLNAAHCCEKIGEHEKAYVALIDARNISEQFRFGWTGINANFALGAYLADYGRDVESGDFRGLAEKYMSAAVSRIEDHPLLYTSRSGRIRKMYNRYSEFLVNSGKGERAFLLQERLSRVERITSLNSINPVFSDEYDRSRYFTYLSEISKLGDIRDKRSALLVTGAASTSAEVEQLNRKEKSQEEKLFKLFRNIKIITAGLHPFSN